MAELKIWYNSEETDYVIAESAADAMLVCAKNGGWPSVKSYQDDTGETEADWQPWADEAPFPFTEELDESTTVAELKPEPGAVVVMHGERTEAAVYYRVEKDGAIYFKTSRKLPAEWIAEMGRGYFASVEY